jgi:glycosyltransferase involved in cell wall biosynthesis
MLKIDKLSVLIPVFNEEATIYTLLTKLIQVSLVHDIKKEIIVINDCSADKTAAEIERFIADNPGLDIHLFSHPVNRGKGAALHTGISVATGDFLVIQDADNEYDPQEYNDLLKPVIMGFADVVYGSRFMGSNPHRILFFWHTIGNKFLTFLANMFSNLNLTDMETCYKLFNTKMLQSLNLKEKRFGFEPEVTIKISRIPKVRIYEIGISYYGRGYEEGKKIGWKDGFRAIYCIFKYGLFSR